jgi:hypothetical protein
MPDPDFQPIPSPDEPFTALDELVRSHGAATVLRSLGRVLRNRGRDLRTLEPDSVRAIRRAARSCERRATELEEGEVSA